VAEVRVILYGFHGAEAPLFHGSAGIRLRGHLVAWKTAG
jgi:hypothetical protein